MDITLVDRHTYNAFQPLLYQVATAGLNPGDVTFFLRATRMSQKNVSFRQGEVTGIDTGRAAASPSTTAARWSTTTW